MLPPPPPVQTGLQGESASLSRGLHPFPTGHVPSKLQEVQIPLISLPLCRLLYGHLSYITLDMLCAGDITDMRTVCEVHPTEGPWPSLGFQTLTCVEPGALLGGWQFRMAGPLQASEAQHRVAFSWVGEPGVAWARQSTPRALWNQALLEHPGFHMGPGALPTACHPMPPTLCRQDSGESSACLQQSLGPGGWGQGHGSAQGSPHAGGCRPPDSPLMGKPSSLPGRLWGSTRL